ncbi:MAG TPA: DUF4124 domain-containing protein [Candidatus Ozemobacteraceae bacterium]|nr:DUF4124 domain-containing protein [Candidatus Ozemobacteraceae bacterium]
MKNRSLRAQLSIVIVLSLLWMGLCGVADGQTPGTTFVYKTVKEYGPLIDLKNKLRPGEQIHESEREGFGYIVRAVPITSEQHLMQLLGAPGEDRLSDTQKGILEVYRLGQTQEIGDIQRNAPAINRAVTVNLVDITGCEDRQKFPGLRNDFWPRASKQTSYSGNRSVRDIDILISGVDSQGYGARTAAEMKATFVHEIAHTLDLGQIEFGAYGSDGDHWFNEVTTEKAAFCEGFANYIVTLLYPSRARDFRGSLQQIRIENASGTYQYISPSDPRLKASDLLKVEGVVTLTLHQITLSIPNGRDKVLAAFRESNSWDNGLGKFLQTLIRLNPSDAVAIVKVVDDETFKRLSNAEIRALFGHSALIEPYLQTRSDPAGQRQVRPGTATPAVGPGVTTPPPAGGRARIYKWKDKDGRLHFTDSPPPPGVEYTVMSPQKISPLQLDGGKSNPYQDD